MLENVNQTGQESQTQMLTEEHTREACSFYANKYARLTYLFFATPVTAWMLFLIIVNVGDFFESGLRGILLGLWYLFTAIITLWIPIITTIYLGGRYFLLKYGPVKSLLLSLLLEAGLLALISLIMVPFAAASASMSGIMITLYLAPFYLVISAPILAFVYRRILKKVDQSHRSMSVAFFTLLLVPIIGAPVFLYGIDSVNYLAVKSNNEHLCWHGSHSPCYFRLAHEYGNIGACEKISPSYSESYRTCYYLLRKHYGDSKFCAIEFMKTESYVKECKGETMKVYTYSWMKNQ